MSTRNTEKTLFFILPSLIMFNPCFFFLNRARKRKEMQLDMLLVLRLSKISKSTFLFSGLEFLLLELLLLFLFLFLLFGVMLLNLYLYT